MIKVLDSFIADKIAAGEVIERPVSIVKELVENSIDAGASSIIVEIKNGGKSYIRVTDDGCGIPCSEVPVAFLRHATSKISGISDLDSISSLGFRGEALASIAAVSRLTIVTKTVEEACGVKMLMHGGQEISTESVGANVGTTIVVEDVFYNTPARRKFMGSDAREAAVIIELIEHYAICYDGIKFRLINNGNTVFTTNGDTDKLNAIITVYPTREYSDLIPINSDMVSGYISNPGVTRNSRRGQLFFVNGRLVNSPVIEKAIEKGYGDRIFSGYPIAILFINVDPSTIDVNIHPGKREINFLKKDEIINAIADAINAVMDSSNSVVHVEKHLKASDRATDETTIFNDTSDASTIDTTENAKLDKKLDKKRIEPLLDIKEYLGSLDRPVNDTESDSKVHEDSEFDKHYSNRVRPFEFSELEYKGYVFNAYIIMQARDNLYILDQHAAHERIFYEQFTDNYLSKEQIPQPMIAPIIINVSADDYCKERDWMHFLRTMGYDIDDFGPNTFIIKGIPEYMTTGEAEGFARTYIDNIGDFSNNKTVIDKLIMKSCKSAVKANERLSEMEIAELLRRLSECRNPFSCPHGRPTFIRVSKYDIERSFKRK